MIVSRLSSRTVLALSSLLLLLLVSSCGDDTTQPPQDVPFNGTIYVLDDRFSPANVTIAVGDSVTWVWQGVHPHTVTQGTTADVSEDPSRLFDYPRPPAPPTTTGTFGYRFTTAGPVPYFCRPHLAVGMKGLVTVK